MIDLKFWKQKPVRPNNPSYSSKLVEESLFVPSYEKERFEARYNTILPQRSRSVIEINQDISKKQQPQASLLLLTQNKKKQAFENDSRIQKIKKDTMKQASMFHSQPIKMRQKLDSNIKQLTNEFNDFIASSNEIYQRQQKPFDIIKGTPKKYKSEINLFPKLRLQRLDDDYQKRQAFIRGDIEKIRKLQQRKRSERNFFSNRIYNPKSNDFKYERISLRKREPIEFAFKITENPEIIKKKLALEK